MDPDPSPVEPEHEPLVRVSALHALRYCERLFYLEEVEEIRLADESVFAGRTLHEELAEQVDGQEYREFYLSSPRIGLVGRVDAFRRREGGWVPYEHKRGRARVREGKTTSEAWPSDALQVAAYSMLLEEATGETVAEGRVRYHADNTTVRIPLDAAARVSVEEAVRRARELRGLGIRPPITTDERLCLHCSLAPVCLPEEERLAGNPRWEPVRLFPATPEGEVIHVISPRARVARSGRTLVITTEDPPLRQVHPIEGVASLVVHGYGQVTTQALHLCGANGIPVHWLTGGGRYVGGMFGAAPGPQRRILQYKALTDPGVRLRLARRLVLAKTEGQLRFLLRATRGVGNRPEILEEALQQIRDCLGQVSRAEGTDSLRGLEGLASQAYFRALPILLAAKGVPESLRPDGRNRRPPKDRFNAALSFGYALLFRSVQEAVMAVGLEPTLGFFHTPRSSAPPLVLDLLDLFRVPVWDMTLIGSLNRRHWDVDKDFALAKDHVWLTDAGRRKAIHLYEERLEAVWKHPVTGYSLSYARMMELEVRLLEKEWISQPGLFARFRLR